MSINHDDVGAWLLKGNPKQTWDYWAKRNSEQWVVGVKRRQDWSLGNTYRNGLIEPGDRIVLYMTGDTHGVVEIGLRNEEPLYYDEWDPDYVIDSHEKGKLKPIVSYDGVLLPTPIGRASIKAVPTLAGAEFLRAPQMTNPTYLTHAEVGALAALIDPGIVAAAGW